MEKITINIDTDGVESKVKTRTENTNPDIPKALPPKEEIPNGRPKKVTPKEESPKEETSSEKESTKDESAGKDEPKKMPALSPERDMTEAEHAKMDSDK